jgi:transposase, IS5 family
MLTLVGEQVESLWDEVLPAEIRRLPEDLARLDRVLSDSLLLLPIAQSWEQDVRERGRPSISMATFVRLMVIKQRTGWGYETLVREVSDSLQLRRFCLIAIDQRVPDESTVRKLARRLGASVVQEITRMVIEKAQRETRFIARAARIDSTVVEADIRYPSDAMLALQRARALAREGKKLQTPIAGKVRVRDRSRSIGKTTRAISKTLARRTGEAKAQVMTLNEQAGRLIARSAREAKRLAAAARASARGRRASAKLAAAGRLEELASRCGRVAEQIDRRVRGVKITDRLVSIADPDARPIRKGKLGKPTEFGYVAQICEVTENTRKSARVHPPRRPRVREPVREQAVAPDRRRTGPRRDPPARDRGRRRLPPRPDQTCVPRLGRRPDPALRPPRARLAPHPQTPSALPHRDRGPHQPSQTRLRHAPHPAQGRSRDADLDRVGDPRPRPRHPRHPNPLKQSTSPTPPGNHLQA